MDSKDIIKNIRERKFKPVYLLHGEEPFYIDKIADELESHVLSDAERGFNQTILYGKDTDVMTILNAAKRYPMMSEYQLVLVKEAQDLKWGKEGEDDKKGPDPFASYLASPLSSTVLVLCYKYGKLDKRKKIYKHIDSNGLIFESAELRDYQLPKWIEDFTSDKGYRIQPKAAALLGEYLGTDLSKISNELEKLMLNIQKGQEISIDDIQNNIGISKEYNVFELQNAIARRDAFKVNQIINYFAANPKTNPIQMVLAVLNGWFVKVLKMHYAPDKSTAALARFAGINPYLIKDYELAARAYNVPKLFNIISYIRECDLRSKGVDATGNTTDGELMKELFFKIIH